MFLTIGLSFQFCFFFFMPLMLVCGPERSVRIEDKLYDPASFGCCCRCGGLDVDRSRKAREARKTAQRLKDANEAAGLTSDGKPVHPEVYVATKAGLAGQNENGVELTEVRPTEASYFVERTTVSA